MYRLVKFSRNNHFLSKIACISILLAVLIADFSDHRISLAQGVCDPNAAVTRVSVASDGTPANGFYNGMHNPAVVVSSDGRFTAFTSSATNLVAHDDNKQQDVFVYDRQTCTTRIVSVSTDGVQGNDYSIAQDISADGRYVLFWTQAKNLVPNAVPFEMLLHDLQTGATTRPYINPVFSASFSHNGRYLVFPSTPDIAHGTDLFIYDFQNGLTTPVPLVAAGQVPSTPSETPSVSDDGRYIAFYTHQSFDASDTDIYGDIYVKDQQTGQITLATVPDSGNAQANGRPRMSADGRFIAFATASSLDPDDKYFSDVYVRDRQTGTLTWVSIYSNGEQLSGTLGNISADGRFVTFRSGTLVYVHDLITRQTALIQPLWIMSQNPNYYPDISSDGKYVAFASEQNGLVPNDTNNGAGSFIFKLSDLYAPFVVNTTDDIDDGLCDANHCSLREAIEGANTTGAQTRAISFVIPGSGVKTIQPTSALPILTSTVTISGYSQSGFNGPPLIELDGSLAGPFADGLTLTAGKSGIYAMVINHFAGSGIHLSGVGGNSILNNYIGTDASGMSAHGNGQGILIESSNNTVGGHNLISGNRDGIVISGSQASGNDIFVNYIGTDVSGINAVGNVSSGITIENAADNKVGEFSISLPNVISANGNGVVISGPGATRNEITGNNIGVDANSSGVLGNLNIGVLLTNGATANLVGWYGGNIIANGSTGVRVENGSSNNIFKRNAIFSNTGNGIEVLDSSIMNNITENSMYSNGGLGIDLGADGVTPNDPGDTDAGPNNRLNYPVISDALIGPSGQVSVRGIFNGPLGNNDTVIEFFVGDQCSPSGYGVDKFSQWWYVSGWTEPNGNMKLNLNITSLSVGQYVTFVAHQGGDTSEFSACQQAVSGQTGPTYVVNNIGDRGAICEAESCSLREAIAAANSDATVSTISFAIPATGVQTIQLTSPLPAITEAVTIDGTTQTGFAGTPLIELSGVSAGANADGLSLINAGASQIRGLIINRFSGHGIVVNGGQPTIAGNYIGTDATGTAAAGNGLGGVNEGGIWVVTSLANTVIGGKGLTERNIISGNNPNGIVISGNASSIVAGNYIGVNAAGNATLPNVTGIRLEGNFNTVGQNASYTQGNMISGNSGAGIVINGSNNTLLGNRIGTDFSGVLDLGNQGAGIDVMGSGNRIGASDSAQANLIAFNQGGGVIIRGNASWGNSLFGNRIYSNGGLGIDLGGDGVTSNDADDADIGPNHLLNYPLINRAKLNSSSVLIEGTFDGQQNEPITLVFYASPSCNLSDYGEGQVLIGTVTALTNENGHFSFSQSFAISSLSGWVITAIATDPNNRDSSEFSRCIMTSVESLPNAAPERNYFVTHQPILTWNRVTVAIGYQVQVATDNQFNHVVYEDSEINADTLFWQTPVIGTNGRYFWRVRAKLNATQWGMWSGTDSFSIDVPIR